MIGLAAAWAAAPAPVGGERLVPHGFLPAPEAPLFARAEAATVRGTAKGDDCAGAVAAALAEVQRAPGGRVLAVTGPAEIPCHARRAGDAVTASVVELPLVRAVDGPGAPVPVARQLLVFAALSGLAPGAPVLLEAGPAGAVWVAPRARDDAGPADPAARGARVFDGIVSPWIAAWAHALAGLPEVGAARLEVEVAGEKGRAGLLRFTVPEEAAARWLAGDLADDGLGAASEIAWAPDARKPAWGPLALDLESTPRADRAVEVRTGTNVDEDDLRGLEDAETP